jgi:hypothetical protein
MRIKPAIDEVEVKNSVMIADKILISTEIHANTTIGYNTMQIIPFIKGCLAMKSARIGEYV